MNFEELVTTRHSAVNFIEDVKISEEEFKKMFDLTKLAPSAYNLQMAHYLVITDPAKKERIYELSYQQYKIHTASAAIIVMGNKNSLEMDQVEKIYGPLKMLKIMDEVDYEMTMNMIQNFAEKLKADNKELSVELARNVGIHAMLFMLSAKHFGYDTCPMHVHNVDQLREEFNIPEYMEPIMLITIGKSVDKERPRGYRKPFGEFVNFNGF